MKQLMLLLVLFLSLALVPVAAQSTPLWEKNVAEGDLTINLRAFRSPLIDKTTGQSAYINLWGGIYTANEKCNAPATTCTYVVSVRWTLDGVQQPPMIEQLPATKWPKYGDNGEQIGYQQATVRVALKFPPRAVIQDVAVQSELRESLGATVLRVENWQSH
jgi:hypothetical protein